MTKKSFVLICSVSLLSFACGSASDSNTNANVMPNSNVTITNAADLPPGMSTAPVQPSANTTPGIPPANQVTNVPAGATPTPGIDPKNALKPMKPGATPTPGIPDAETIKRQMSQPPANFNGPPPSNGAKPPAQKP
jgi:type IV secretory pathway VirB10-like protein